jgi:hypothetical protein
MRELEKSRHPRAVDRPQEDWYLQNADWGRPTITLSFGSIDPRGLAGPAR